MYVCNVKCLDVFNEAAIMSFREPNVIDAIISSAEEEWSEGDMQAANWRCNVRNDVH